jgi:drug/metabolite transporter (DMT)-like permease
VDAVLLAVVAALGYGVGNLIGPVLARSRPIASVLIIGQCASFVAACIYVTVIGDARPSAHYLLLAAAAGIVNAGAIGGTYLAASSGPISIIIAIGGGGTIIPVLYGIVDGERPDALQLAAMPIAIVGIVLAAMRHEDATHHADRRCLLWSVFAAACGGTFMTVLARASAESPSWALVTNRLTLLIALSLTALVLRKRVSVPLRAVPLLALPALLLFLATASYAVATTKGLLSVVSVVTSLNPVITIGLAALLLHERLARRQQAGVALAVVGIILIAAG